MQQDPTAALLDFASRLSRRELCAGMAVAAGVPAAGAAERFAPDMPRPRVYRTYDGKDGRTHIDRIEFEPRRIGLGVPLGSQDMAASASLMASGPVNLFQATGATVNLIADPPRASRGNFHWSVRPALALILQGQWEFGTTDGAFATLIPGDFLKVEDHSPVCGGHTQRVIGPEWGLEIATFLVS